MAESILLWGADFIVTLQQFTWWPWEGLMRFVSGLGGMGYLFMVPLVLWGVDRRLGVSLVLLLALTMYLNTVVKEWFELARPYMTDSRILSEGEIGYSFPSGHAQLVVVFWGLLALWVGKRWFTGLCLMLMFLTGLSRSYLGVHYPSDVVVGWLLGGLTLWAWQHWAGVRQGGILEHCSLSQRAVALFVVTAVLLAVAVLLGSTAMVYGSLGMGLAAGLSALVVADAPHMLSVARRALRCGLGLAVMFATLALLSKIAGWSSLPAAVDSFMLTGLFAVVITALLPWLFQRVRL
ncbi:MAG TPA: hypothetical protein DIW43_18085 [Spongiibacteraceae bacterium]|nr:hypothetical protein [Spongiibacteraceae bacterium]HCS29372.1 hypothetical protein [Spongiibacteraceae bacterium]